MMEHHESANVSGPSGMRPTPTVSSRQRGDAAPSLQSRLEQAAACERQRAVRILLQRPLLTADGPNLDEYGLVRRHAEWLRDWFSRNLEWRLQVDGETVRLRKTPDDLTDHTRPACDTRSSAPFTRRRYVILCLALASLERSDRQTTLGRLAEDVVTATRADPALGAAGITLELENFDHRRDLVQVMRLLLEYRVLVHVHGDEQQYLQDKGDVLYNVYRPALSGMLNVKRGPSTIPTVSFDERLRAMLEEALPDTDEARNRQIRIKLLRRLVDDPVLYYRDLADNELAYLNSQRGRLIRELEEATGLIAEIRREGIAMVDDRGDLTDIGLPEEGTDGHLTLLVAEYLAKRVREDHQAPVAMALLVGYVAELIKQHRAHWRKAVLDPGAEIVLTERTVDRLASLRLVRRTIDGVMPLPAIGRYALSQSETSTSSDQVNEEPLLWEDVEQ